MLEMEEATTMTTRCRVLIWSSQPAFVRAMRSLQVDHRYLVARGGQGVDHVGTDEAGAAGDP